MRLAPLPFAQLAPPDDLPHLRPPLPEIPPTLWEQYGLSIVLSGLLLLALACAAAWRLTRPKPPVVVPPEVQARRKLETLRQQTENGAVLSRVSQTLREYFAVAFSLPAGEMTTTEFCLALDASHQAGQELSAAVNAFLRQCDQRKFSPSPPASPLGAVTQALQLIDRAQARLAVLPELASQSASVQPASSKTEEQS